MRHRRLRGSRSSKSTLVVGSTAALIAALGGLSARASVETIINGGYHAQSTDYFCAAASMEMELDVAAVKNTNAFVVNMINAGDGGTVPHGAAPPAVGLNNGQVTAGAQTFIYNLVHGLNTFNGQSYLNPFAPPGKGTDNTAVAVGLNLIDNPNVNGTTGPAIGNHAYNAFNFAPTFAGGAYASRTIANALGDYQIPAVISTINGRHAISVYGVSTSAAPGRNQQYNINGFYVHDPWTGWAVQQLRGGVFDPNLLGNGGLGFGYNTYFRYGYDNDPRGQMTQLPNGNFVPVRLAPWFKYFNPAPGQPGAGPAMSALGYKFEVEPLGPELPDDGNGGLYDSLPTPPTELGTQVPHDMADDDAAAGIAADPTLSALPAFHNGSFDQNDEMLLMLPTDITGDGDWLVPYDGPAPGTNDITGAVLIDSATGVIDEATWIDPTDPGQTPLTLNEIQTLFTNQFTENLPSDNPVPEPACVGLIALGAMQLSARRVRRS